MTYIDDMLVRAEDEEVTEGVVDDGEEDEEDTADEVKDDEAA